MNTALLTKMFGKEQRWCGSCTVVMDAEATVQALGVDSIVGGGTKAYSPRMVSGRIHGDAVCLVADGSALLIVQQQKVRSATGEEILKQTLIVADSTHIVAVEFADTNVLASLGLPPPPQRLSGSQHGLNVSRPPVG